ncbi:nitroreductase [Spirosoma sp. HMF4905]|uniref:Nitroreductase n=1 Tax=Spirosoma arboris TaxID=2682092 RepID=A0A7K1SFE0_9BACT|nr:nitroreductase family protein [Spirosoma arboris]MVM32535.1 nitroreductase [Spirosoma arboris]
MVKKIRHRLHSIYKNVLPTFFIGTPFVSSVYYLLFSSNFRREERAVLAGKVKHLKDSNKEKASMYTLIRNVHRLEKGLLMRPRREVFALDFIGETMNNFQTLYRPESCVENSQIKWAHDVLNEYFSVTGSHPALNAERERFNKITASPERPKPTSIPYQRIETNKPSISYDSFYKLTKYRRSVRWFQDKKVPHELLDKAILAANQAPTACNRQPYSFRIIDEAEMLDRIVKIPMGTKGYSQNIPMMVVVVGHLDAYFDERDRHLIYIDSSLAAMSLILALETLGLGSCIINWPDIEVKELQMQKILKLENYQRPIMCIAIGIPDSEGMVAYSEKRSLQAIRSYN